MKALLDTSVLIGPPIGETPEAAAISIVTIAELRLGVLTATGAEERAARLERLVAVESAYRPLPIDDDVAGSYAAIVASERERGRRPRAMDALIAATALARGLTLYTRDEALAKVASLRVKLVR